MKKIILASQSPRRFDLLKSLGLDVVVIPSHIEEVNIHNLSPEKYTQKLAQEKLESVKNLLKKDLQGFPLIAADTIVVLDKEIIEKPNDRKHATQMLQSLSGKTHRVITSYVCFFKNKMCQQTVETKVKFKKLDVQEIDWYLSHEEPYDKAGAYAMQGRGAFMIEFIHGSHTNVIGLPLSHVIADLSALGFEVCV